MSAWRRAAARNEAHYQEIRGIVRTLESAIAAETVPPPPRVDAVARRAGQHYRFRRPPENHGWIWRAAGVAGAIAAAILIYLLPFEKAPELNFGKGEFVTGATEYATLVLADGTVVRLGPNSRLRVPGVPGSREVFLDGQAFFAVAKMPGYPFRVRTTAGEARVLGTRFEIRTDNHDLRLVVLEGRVALEAGSEQVEVGMGEMSLITDGAPSAPVKVENIKPLVPWLERFIVFQATPLADVAVELEREYGRRVEVSDSALAGLTVTGWYADKSFEEVISVVCGVVRAKCAIEDSVARIQAR